MTSDPSQNSTHSNVDSEAKSDPERQIVFFDGVCALCNGSVNFLMKRDGHSRLKFAPLQGTTAATVLPVQDQQLNSIVVYDGTHCWRSSSAIVRILWSLPQPWPVLGTLLWFVPKPLRDFGYGLVARSRYRLFGKHETCRMPTEEDRGRILD